MHVIGRETGSGPRDREGAEDGGAGDGRPPTGHLGRYLARDGSHGAAVGLDCSRPHAGLVVGKRGAGKSHTLGVIAEMIARTDGLAPVVCDPMDAFTGLAATSTGAPVPATLVADPTVRADAISPSDWPALVGLDSASAPGSLVWAAAAAEPTLAGMRTHVTRAKAGRAVVRAAANHLSLADAWGVFDPAGLTARDLLGGDATVLSLSGLADAAASAVVAAVARCLYAARVGDGAAVVGKRHRDAGSAAETDTDAGDGVEAMPWLLVDEAHVAFAGVAESALRTLMTRGRAPGVSLIAATQRPGALPGVAVSQADLLVAHRLSSAADLDALTAARPRRLEGLAGRLPDGTGEALVVDDATARTHRVRVRTRDTPHGGGTPTVSDSVAPSASIR